MVITKKLQAIRNFWLCQSILAYDEPHANDILHKAISFKTIYSLPTAIYATVG